MNSVILLGRLARDPELRHTQGGTAVTNFTLAVDKGLSREKRQEFEAQGRPTADFIDIVAWGGTAELVANNLAKGLRVGVSGRIENGQYQDKDGKTVYTTSVNAFNVTMIDWKDDKSNSGPADDFGALDNFHPASNENIPF